MDLYLIPKFMSDCYEKGCRGPVRIYALFVHAPECVIHILAHVRWSQGLPICQGLSKQGLSHAGAYSACELTFRH